MRSRMALLLVLLAAWTGVLAVRLHRVQVADHEHYLERARGQHFKKIELTPPRGTILDAKGRTLAVSVSVESAYAPRGSKRPEETAAAISSVLGIDARELAQRLTAGKWMWIARQIDPAAVADLRSLDVEGVEFVRESKRVYPLGALAGSVLGFVGVDHTGLAGLEAAYDDIVAGEPLARTMLRDALDGRAVAPGLSFLDAEPGEDLRLTIDVAIQHVVERELARAVEEHSAKAATAVLMDPASGAIFAMASLPSFDPNRFASFPPGLRRNRAVQDAFEPGSTLKLATAAAALEANVLDPLDILDCENGAITLGRTRIRDHKAFDLLTFGEVIANSSNVGAIKAGVLIGPEGLYRQIEALGFGRETGVDLPGESKGIVRPVERWSRHEVAYASIGQGLSVTSLQLARAFGVVANGGFLVTPHVVSSIGDRGLDREPVQKRQVLSAATIRTLVRMLEAVVDKGTGVSAAVSTYRVAGKTGTAQKAGSSGYEAGRYVASFAGFAPSRTPRLVGVVALDEPRGRYHGGEVAAPVFARILNQVLPLLGVAPDAPERSERRIPARLAERNPEELRENAIAQDGDAGREREVSSPETVPDFAGLSAREAIALAARTGLEIRLEGSGFVRQQSPAPGTGVDDRRGVVLQLEAGRVG